MKYLILSALLIFSFYRTNAQCVTPISEGCGNGGYTWEYNLDPGSTINLTTLTPAGSWFVSYDMGTTWQVINAPGTITNSGSVWILGVDPDPASFFTLATCGWDFSDCSQAGATFNVSGGHDCLIDACNPCGVIPPACTPATITVDLVNDVTCLGGSNGLINTTVTGSSTYTITWDNGITSNSDDISMLMAGAYTITATDDLDATCIATTTVVVDPGVQPNIAANTSGNNVCSGDPIVLTGSGGVSYIWDNGVTDNTPFNIVSTTTYTVTGTDGNGCTNTDQVTVNVIACTTPVADFSATDSTLCEGDCIDFTDLSVSAAAGITNWAWDFGNGQTSSDQNPTNICYTIAGSYSVELVVTDANGMNTETEVNFINVTNCAGPTIQFSATDSTLCEGDCINFTDLSVSSAGGLTNWVWDFGNGQTSADQNPVGICYAVTGVYTVELTGTDANGSNTTSISNIINVISCGNLQANFEYSIIPICGGVELKLENTTVGATDFLWNVGDDIVFTNEDSTLVIDYGQSINVSLTASNGLNSDVFNQNIEILTFKEYQTFEMPNIFTPNGDGFNDRLEVPIDGKMENCASFKVYNRWGQLMFASSANSFYWDGTTPVGEEVPSGTYFYTFEITGETCSGTINLKR